MSTTELIDAWRQFRDERSVALCATTLASDYTQVERWLERCPVQDLERGRDVLTWVLKQQPQKATLRVGMFVKSLYRWASSPDVALLGTNPVLSFRFPKRPQSHEEIVVIPRAELPLVFAGLQRLNPTVPQWDLWAQFQLQTGLRTGEVRAVREADIDGDYLLVHANFTLTHGLKDSTKTNRRRRVPLNSVARGILDGCTPADGYLFPWSRHSFQGFFKERMSSLYEQRVISRRYRPYDLRHTAISGWLESGIPVAQVASWAGNTAEVIWKHYASTTVEHEIPVL